MTRRHLQLVLLKVSKASIGLGNGEHPCPARALQLHLLPQLPPEAGELRVVAAPVLEAPLSGPADPLFRAIQQWASLTLGNLDSMLLWAAETADAKALCLGEIP